VDTAGLCPQCAPPRYSSNSSLSFLRLAATASRTRGTATRPSRAVLASGRTVELKLHPVGEPGSLSGGVQGIEQAGPEGPPQDHRDRRFNRRKYDATKTVEAFSTCLRDELYLDTLSAEPCGRSNDTTHHRVAWLRPSVSSSTNGDQAI
jgi:hypothetical protein